MRPAAYFPWLLHAMRRGDQFAPLWSYLARVPSLTPQFATGAFESGCWWVKFSLDIEHPLAWNVVQEFGHVFNEISVEERLPTVFMPVSPAPYLNGGPADFLSWVIESKDPSFEPSKATEWLEGRLPNPVDDVIQWESDDEEDEDEDA
jgi:hypothetical protein